MRVFAGRPARASLMFALLLLVTSEGCAQAFRVTVANTRREVSGGLWASGNWAVFSVDEDERDLNGDGDTDDSVLTVLDLLTLKFQETRLALDTTAGEEEERVVAFSGDRMVFQVSEQDSGGKDLNGNGRAGEAVLFLYDATARKATNLGVTGNFPAFAGDKLYFAQPEAVRGKDLNGDGDLLDTVLCACDLTTLQVESLGMECKGNFKLAGDWIATLTSEAAQGGKDLNGDKDLQDSVLQLYQISTKKWTNTALASESFALTEQVLAAGVGEASQGGKDLNGDRDIEDEVCFVWDLATGHAKNTGQDCSDGLAATGALVGFVTNEDAQGKTDLNGDGDANDSVLQYFALGSAKAVNLRRDASGGLEAAAGKLAFICSEEDDGKKDLNRDRDTDDTVLMIFDPARNSVLNTTWAVDGDLVVGSHYLAWATLESDQGDRDLNRDGDTDDSVLLVMDLATNGIASTGTASSGNHAAAAAGIPFACPETDQGDRDLNSDGDTSDEVLQVARFAR